MIDLVLLVLKLEQLHNTPQHLTTIVSPRQHSLNDESEYNIHLMHGPEGNSKFCFPESPDVFWDLHEKATADAITLSFYNLNKEWKLIGN